MLRRRLPDRILKYRTRVVNNRVRCFEVLGESRPSFSADYFVGVSVRYDSEKSFIGTDFVSAMSAVSEKQSDYVRHMQMQLSQPQLGYQPHEQDVHMQQYGASNPQESYDTRSASFGFYKVTSIRHN
jgi:hypothetical protein